MKNRHLKSTLEKITRNAVTEDVDLWRGIESQLAGKGASKMKTQFKFSTSLVIALITLLLVSTAVYAYYRFLGSDPGLQGVDEQNLITNIETVAIPTVYSIPPEVTPLSKWSDEISAPPATIIAEQAMQDVKVTLDWAYADESRVAIRFSISGLDLPEGLDYAYSAPETFSLTDMSGNVLGQDGFSTAAETRPYGSNNYVVTAIYYGKLDADKTPTLDLKLNVRVGGFDAPYTPPGSDTTEMRNIPLMGSTQFEFSIPVYEGFDVPVDQSVEQHGVTMRLESMTVNRSHTEILVCFNLPSDKDWQLYKATLRIDDSDEYPGSMAAMGMSEYVKDIKASDGTERCITLGFDAPYDGSSTTMTVTVPYLLTPVTRPEITEERVAWANKKLEEVGIVFEYVNDDVRILHKPDDVKEWDAYPMAWEALADQYDGPWMFTVQVSP